MNQGSSSNSVSPNLQTLQHYLQKNNQPSSSSDPQGTRTRQVQPSGRSHYLHNRQVNQPDDEDGDDDELEEEEIIVKPERKPFWLVVEMEATIINKYFLVDAKDVTGYPDMDTLNTGKLIYATVKGKLRRCNVVMASEDRKFIFAEYNQLNKISEDNLRMKDVQYKKRRRVSSPEPSCSRRRDNDDDSSISGWSGVSQAQTKDRVVSPSAHVHNKLGKNQETRIIKPMNYDQGTQTNNETTTSGADFSKEIIRLLEMNEQLLNEQKLLRNETKVNRLLVEGYSDDFSALRNSLKLMESKIDNMTVDRHHFNIENDSITSKKVTSTKILNGTTQPYYIIDQIGGSIDDQKHNISNIEYTVEELTEANDSGRSTSRMSFSQDQNTMMSNSSLTSGEFNSNKKQSFRRSASSSNFSIQSTSSSTPLAKNGRPSGSNQSLSEEWAEADGDFMIGSNKTTVPVHVLRSIDWGNYKSATRKMLITLFSRETLATRSLTGRPSPAFHDRNKPVKGKLDQDIINDIIQLVTKKCGAQESQVRTAITTKCADENKMLRNRKENEEKEKEKFKQPAQTAANGRKEADKENFHGNGI